MQMGSRRMRLAVTAATFVWLIGVALATRGTGMSTPAAAASSSLSNKKAAASTASSKKAEPAVTVGATCGTASYTQAGAQAGSAPKTQMSEEAFKSVQLLKGIPVDEFMGTMGLFSAALSMCCLECHQADWAADTPRKITARKMITMVNTINRTNFSGRKVVTAGPAIASSIGLRSRRRSISCTANRSTGRPTISSSRRPARRRPIQSSTSTFRLSAAPTAWPGSRAMSARARRAGSGRRRSGRPLKSTPRLPISAP